MSVRWAHVAVEGGQAVGAELTQVGVATRAEIVGSGSADHRPEWSILRERFTSSAIRLPAATWRLVSPAPERWRTSWADWLGAAVRIASADW